MATHSSILAWRIPWTEEPDRQQSTGLQNQTRLNHFHSSLTPFNTDSQNTVLFLYHHPPMMTDLLSIPRSTHSWYVSIHFCF